MAVLAEIGAPQPKSVLPIDAFRRLQASVTSLYDLDGGEKVDLALFPVSGTTKMVVRHIVRTVKRDGVVVDIGKVGEAVFHKPPPTQQRRARLVVRTECSGLPDREAIEAFAAALREEYERGISDLDAQAGRRIVRSYLATVNALYLDGPYFIPDEKDAVQLVRLLAAMGGECRAQVAPLVDDEPRRQMLADALGRAVAAEETTERLMEAYAPLGLP